MDLVARTHIMGENLSGQATSA